MKKKFSDHIYQDMKDWPKSNQVIFNFSENHNSHEDDPDGEWDFMVIIENLQSSKNEVLYLHYDGGNRWYIMKKTIMSFEESCNARNTLGRKDGIQYEIQSYHRSWHSCIDRLIEYQLNAESRKGQYDEWVHQYDIS